MSGFQKPSLGGLALFIFFIIVISAAVFLFPHEKTGSVNPVFTNPCHKDLFGNLDDTCVPLLRITGENTTKISNFSNPRTDNAPSAEECKILAYSALEPYGGMPADSAFESMSESQGHIGNVSFIGSRRLEYRQSPYGMPIYGYDGTMWFDINLEGGLEYLSKHWLSYEEMGLIRIIPASEALSRFKTKNEKENPGYQLNLTIHDIRLGYYNQAYNVSAYLEPVWVVNATNEIRGTPQLVFIPAEEEPGQLELYHRDLFGKIPDFMQTNGSVPSPDIPQEMQYYLVGTTGPLGEEQIKESIRIFLNQPVNLTYQGRAVRKYRCGDEYLGDYSVASAGNCSFEVDSYSGMVIKAFLDSSCPDIRIANLPAAIKNDPDSARKLIANFTRSRYPGYDAQDIAVIPMGWDGGYFLKGESVRFLINFDPGNGNLETYQLFNSHSDLTC